MDASFKELLPSIERAVPWSMLEPRLQRLAETLGASSHTTWQRFVLKYHSDYHLPYTPSCPLDFYKDLLRDQRLCLQVYPYHLAYQSQALDFPDPFEYYVELLCDALRTGKTYEEIPQFAAADILQVVGIQASGYSEKLSLCRAKGAAGRISKWIRTLLPTTPLTMAVEDWWEVYPLPRVNSARGTVTDEELATLQEVCELTHLREPCLVGRWAKPHLEGLYTMGVIGFHIPIRDDMSFERPAETNGFEGNGGSLFENCTAAVASALQDCRTLNEVTEKLPEITRNVAVDALALLCRLHFTALAQPSPIVSSPARNESFSLYSPTVSDLRSPKLTLLVNGSLLDLPAAQSLSLVALLSLPDPALETHTLISVAEALGEEMEVEICTTASATRRGHVRVSDGGEEFCTETVAADGLFQAFFLKKRGTKVWHFPAGKVVNYLPEEEEEQSMWMIMGEETPMLLEEWETLAALQDALPYQDILLVPFPCNAVCPDLPSASAQVMTVPLPLDLSTCLNPRLREYLTSLQIPPTIGYLEVAYTPCIANSEDVWSGEACCSQYFTLLTLRAGLPLSSLATTHSILTNLRKSSWLQSAGIQKCREVQQVEAFEFQESLCCDRR